LKAVTDMSTTRIGAPPAAPSVDQLVKELVRKVDADKNGQISTEEFGTFLTGLLHGASGQILTAPDQTPVEVPEYPDGEGGTPFEEGPDVHPSTWTANNAPYGITFAGWSPQNHTHLTPEDLGVPGKAEKYAVYNYLLSNRLQPTSDWAPSAAEALNRKYNTTVYRVIDGETLGFGNEYVHSAPNGHGMAPGTFNPSATGEVFYGWI
jgi:hypothetical protein